MYDWQMYHGTMLLLLYNQSLNFPALDLFDKKFRSSFFHENVNSKSEEFHSKIL